MPFICSGRPFFVYLEQSSYKESTSCDIDLKTIQTEDAHKNHLDLLVLVNIYSRIDANCLKLT